jgi:predicted nucleic acid-binding protein
MIVIADSSPIIVLTKIGHLEVLPKLFGEIVIPPAVCNELALASKPQAVRDFAAKPPQWLRVMAPTRKQSIVALHPGETEALTLAEELHADLLLVDERKAYHEAARRKLNAIGTVRVLEMAAEQNQLDLQVAFERVKQTDFWISHQLLDERLKLHQKRSS